MNISRSTAIQHVYCVPKTPSPLFLAVRLAPCWHPFNCIRLIGPNSVTERASDDQRLGRFDDTISVAKLSRVWN